MTIVSNLRMNYSEKCTLLSLMVFSMDHDIFKGKSSEDKGQKEKCIQWFDGLSRPNCLPVVVIV